MPVKKNDQSLKDDKKKLQDFLKEVITIVAGKPSEEIVDLLYSKKYINEFLIAKKLDITINQTRNILYKIADHGLVSNMRKKDKKKGWYTYFWRIESLKALLFLKNHLLKKIDHTRSHFKSRETKIFYICERCGIEMSEENALLNNFTCLECGAIFTLKDNTKLLKELERNLAKFEKDLELVEIEVAKEESKLEKEKELERRKNKKTKKTRRKLVVKKVKPKKKQLTKKTIKKVKKSSKTQKKKKIKVKAKKVSIKKHSKKKSKQKPKPKSKKKVSKKIKPKSKKVKKKSRK